MDTDSFDTSTLFPTGIDLSLGSQTSVSADIGGNSISYSTSAPSGATVGIAQPIYPSFNVWLRNGNPVGAFRGIPGFLILVAVGIIGYILLGKKKVG